MLGYIVIPSTKCLSYFIMKVLGIEIKVTLKVEVTLLLPASPWPWYQRWTLLCIQLSGVYRRALWWPGSWQASPRCKAWPRLRLCTLARISKIMIPLNPSNDLLPSFWTFFTHLVTSPWSQLAYICLTSLTCTKCGIPSTLCWKIPNISGSIELFAL